MRHTRSPGSKHVNLDLEVPIEFASEGIVSKRVAKTSGFEVDLFCLSSGQSLSEHTSSYAATIHILRGRGEILLGKRTYEAKPNAWFHLPPRTPHAVKSKENLVFLLTLFK